MLMSEVETSLQPEQQEQSEQKPAKKGWFGKKEKVKKTPKQELVEWVVTLAVAVAIALVVRTFLFEPVRVDGSSMAETLVNGEIMFVTKPEYLLGDPQRFDVVICHYPDRGDTNFVKRVVGLPGDTVAVENGFLYVNGEKYEENYLTYRPNYAVPPTYIPHAGDVITIGDGQLNINGEPSGLTTVPRWVMDNMTDGQYIAETDLYYVLGDNRSNSNDSHLVGPITRDMIVGHVRSVFFPFNAWRIIE